MTAAQIFSVFAKHIELVVRADFDIRDDGVMFPEIILEVSEERQSFGFNRAKTNQIEVPNWQPLICTNKLILLNVPSRAISAYIPNALTNSESFSHINFFQCANEISSMKRFYHFLWILMLWLCSMMWDELMERIWSELQRQVIVIQRSWIAWGYFDERRQRLSVCGIELNYLPNIYDKYLMLMSHDIMRSWLLKIYIFEDYDSSFSDQTTSRRHMTNAHATRIEFKFKFNEIRARQWSSIVSGNNWK